MSQGTTCNNNYVDISNGLGGDALTRVFVTGEIIPQGKIFTYRWVKSELIFLYRYHIPNIFSICRETKITERSEVWRKTRIIIRTIPIGLSTERLKDLIIIITITKGLSTERWKDLQTNPEVMQCSSMGGSPHNVESSEWPLQQK